MKISLAKLIPRAGALAVVGYCVWPSVAEFMAKPEIPAPPKLPEVAASSLAVKLPETPVRNPFSDPNAPPPVIKNVKIVAAKDVGKSAILSALSAQNKNALKSGQARLPETVLAILGTLNLEATLVSGDQRYAIINGRQYTLKDALTTNDSTIPPCKVVGVFPHKVLLESEGRTFELRYSNGEPRAPAARKVDDVRKK